MKRLLMRITLIMLALSLFSCGSSRTSSSYQANAGRVNCGSPYPIDAAKWQRLQQPYQMFGQWYYPIHRAAGFVEEGEAAWYGSNLNGRPTASGEIFDKHQMTAAHPALPMNSCVRVTNLANGYWVVLRVNDRGPFTNMRVIDVSEAAARYLGFFRPGTAHVRVEVLP